MYDVTILAHVDYNFKSLFNQNCEAMVIKAKMCKVNIDKSFKTCKLKTKSKN